MASNPKKPAALSASSEKCAPIFTSAGIKVDYHALFLNRIKAHAVTWLKWRNETVFHEDHLGSVASDFWKRKAHIWGKKGQWLNKEVLDFLNGLTDSTRCEHVHFKACRETSMTDGRRKEAIQQHLQRCFKHMIGAERWQLVRLDSSSLTQGMAATNMVAKQKELDSDASNAKTYAKQETDLTPVTKTPNAILRTFIRLSSYDSPETVPIRIPLQGCQDPILFFNRLQVESSKWYSSKEREKIRGFDLLPAWKQKTEYFTMRKFHIGDWSVFWKGLQKEWEGDNSGEKVYQVIAMATFDKPVAARGKVQASASVEKGEATTDGDKMVE